MTQPALTSYGSSRRRARRAGKASSPTGPSDQRAFKNVPWGKAMMWIFLLSDTFIFTLFPAVAT